jgi:hypothetical protein
MSLWVHNMDKIYYSIKSLQNEAKQMRHTLMINKEPLIHNMKVCYICKKEFIDSDIINFYSDGDNEYCYHLNECSNIYKFQRNNLIVSNLQNINDSVNIDYSHDNIVPNNIYKLNLIHNYRNHNLDFSQSNLKELIVSDYDKLESDNFNSITLLECYRTNVDFTKFINLNKLKLNCTLENTIISCQKLIDVSLNNINFEIDFTNCINLKILQITNVTKQIILKGCVNLETIELNNVTTLIDVSECTKLKLLKLENMISSNIPQNIYSLTNLHIYNNIDSIDVTSYPNLISLSNNIYNGKNHYGKCIINYDKLIHLQYFSFSDVRFIDNVPIVYNFDFSKNTNLQNLNIYSAINNCNMDISKNLKLEVCTLEFYSDYPIIISKNVKELKYNKSLTLVSI